MPQFRLKTLFLLVAAAALLVGFVVVVLPYRYVSLGIGHFDLTVTIESEVPVSGVKYATFFDRRGPDWVMSEKEKARDVSYWEATPHADGFITCIDCSDKADAYGRELSYVEKRFIVLRCQHSDGTETWKMAEIPKGRGARSMTVSIP